jgi:hypothetical protein
MKNSMNILTAVILLMVFTSQGLAQYAIPRSVLGCGGIRMSSPAYGIVGTIGQPFIGPMSSVVNQHGAGFWYTMSLLFTGVDEEAQQVGSGAIASGLLLHAYPNPFYSTTTISITLSSATDVCLQVYDVLGRELMKLVEGTLTAGTHTVWLDGSDLSSGIYLLQLRTKAGVEAIRVMRTK